MSSIFTTSPPSLLHICSRTFTHISLPDKPFTNALQQQSPFQLSPSNTMYHFLSSYHTLQHYHLLHTLSSTPLILHTKPSASRTDNTSPSLPSLGSYRSCTLRINPQPLRSVAIDYPQPFLSTQIASGIPTHIYHSRDNAFQPITLVIIHTEADLPLANPNLFHTTHNHYHHGGDYVPNTTVFHFLTIRQ